MNELTQIYNEFNSRLSEFGQCYLAGGCVIRDHLMGKTPKDYDFFILNSYDLPYDFNNTKKVITEKLSDLSMTQIKVDFHKSEPYLVSSIQYEGKEVQIMFNPAQNIEELIDSFDWNVCLFGYGNGKFYQSEKVENIGPNKELWLNKVTFPLSTLRRGFRFSERFLMKIKKDDIYLLAEKILENKKNKKEIGAEANEPDMLALEANSLVK